MIRVVPGNKCARFHKQSTPKVSFAPCCNQMQMGESISCPRMNNPTLSWLEAIDSYSDETTKQEILVKLNLSSAKFKFYCKITHYLAGFSKRLLPAINTGSLFTPSSPNSSSSSFGLGRDSPHNISPHLAVTHGCPKIIHIQSGIPGYNFGEGQPPRSHRKMAGAP